VLNSRLQKRSNRVWRRRKCLKCQTTFTTEESALYEALWLVEGPLGSLKAFSRDKLLLSLYNSCQHRSKALEDSSDIADTIIKRLSGGVKDGRINASAIRQVVLVALSRFDKSASTHYLAFHKS
jgi:transcriptional regulator NrdR family protein